MSTTAVEELEEPPRRELTYEEERGKPMPSTNHAIIQSRLTGFFLRHTEFDIMNELSLRLGGKPVTPDISIYPRKPMDLLNDVIVRTDAPLLTVEILSPTQGSSPVLEKVALYLANGVKSVWLVAPPFRLVTIFTPDGQQRTYHNGVVRDPAIGVTADLDAIFS